MIEGGTARRTATTTGSAPLLPLIPSNHCYSNEDYFGRAICRMAHRFPTNRLKFPTSMTDRRGPCRIGDGLQPDHAHSLASM